MTRRTDCTQRPPKLNTFLEMAEKLAEQSTCPVGARHGCIILTKDFNIVAVGYGSPARGVDACPECWLRKKFDETGIKDWTVCPSVHAEANAVANAAKLGHSLIDTRALVTREPCWPCERLLRNAGVAMVIFPMWSDAAVATVFQSREPRG